MLQDGYTIPCKIRVCQAFLGDLLPVWNVLSAILDWRERSTEQQKTDPTGGALAVAGMVNRAAVLHEKITEHHMLASDSSNYYECLGVPAAVSQREITLAYRRLAALFHPDRHSSDPPDVQEQYARRMRAINEAYTVLRNPWKRAEYDRLHGSGLANPWQGITDDVFSPVAHDTGQTAS